MHIAAWIEERQETLAAPSVKQELAAVRMFFDWLVVGQIVPMNPASAVRGPRHIGHGFGKEAGPVEVDVGVQVIPAEGIDLPGKAPRDGAVAQVLAHDRPILRFGQTVVIAVPGP